MPLALRRIDPAFEETIERALVQRGETRAFVASLAGDISEVVFIGVGGSYTSSIHAAWLIDRLGSRIRAANRNAAEFLHATPARLGPGTLVVASSHGGGTPETVAAAELARQRGSPVVAVSSDADTPLGRLGDLRLNYGSDRTITPAKQTLLAGLVAEMLAQGEHGVETAMLDAALRALPAGLHDALTTSETLLGRIAAALTDERPVWVVGSGSGLGAAYTMSVCHLVEMQWMPSAFYAAGDFFHGPFELLTSDAQLLVFAGEDETRPETDRVMSFARRVNRAPHCIDAAPLALPGVPPNGRGLVSGIALGTLGSRLLDHLEAARDHDHDLRRYMGKGPY